MHTSLSEESILGITWHLLAFNTGTLDNKGLCHVCMLTLPPYSGLLHPCEMKGRLSEGVLLPLINLVIRLFTLFICLSIHRSIYFLWTGGP